MSPGFHVSRGALTGCCLARLALEIFLCEHSSRTIASFCALNPDSEEPGFRRLQRSSTGLAEQIPSSWPTTSLCSAAGLSVTGFSCAATGASTCPTAPSAVVNARPLLGAAPNKGGRDDGNPCLRDPARARSAHPLDSTLRGRASSLGLGPRQRARCPPDRGEEPAERVAKTRLAIGWGEICPKSG